MFKGEQSMHQWKGVSWFKLMEQKNVVEDKKLSFIEVVKKNMSINEVNL